MLKRERFLAVLSSLKSVESEIFLPSAVWISCGNCIYFDLFSCC